MQVQRQGAGKSVSYIAQAVLSGKRTMILTSTKALQDQLMKDFRVMGLTDIRGKSNYECAGLCGYNCEDGSVGKCPYRGSGICTYNVAKSLVMDSNLCTSNYSCWMANNRYGTGLGTFELLVMDEAHAVPNELDRAMQISLSDREVTGILNTEWPDSRNDMEVWKHWATVRFILANNEVKRLKDKLNQLDHPTAKLTNDFKHMRNLVRKLADIANCKPEKWVPDTTQHGYKFDPTDSSEYAERMLFCGIEKVIMTTGSGGPKTLNQLGVWDGDYFYREYQTKFNASKSPVYHLPTIRVHKFSQQWELRRLVKQIDKIIESRLDRRFIIHTGNFALRDFIVANSEFRSIMLSNYVKEGDVTSMVIERFKQTMAPVVLVSPSVTTGFDFPYDACRVQIIAKLPFRDSSSKVEQARDKLDDERGAYHCMQGLNQAVFRGDRADDDQQEVFIVDDNITWFLRKYGYMASPYLLAMYQPISHIPSAPKLAA